MNYDFVLNGLKAELARLSGDSSAYGLGVNSEIAHTEERLETLKARRKALLDENAAKLAEIQRAITILEQTSVKTAA